MFINKSGSILPVIENNYSLWITSLIPDQYPTYTKKGLVFTPIPSNLDHHANDFDRDQIELTNNEYLIIVEHTPKEIVQKQEVLFYFQLFNSNTDEIEKFDLVEINVTNNNELVISKTVETINSFSKTNITFPKEGINKIEVIFKKNTIDITQAELEVIVKSGPETPQTINNTTVVGIILSIVIIIFMVKLLSFLRKKEASIK